MSQGCRGRAEGVAGVNRKGAFVRGCCGLVRLLVPACPRNASAPRAALGLLKHLERNCPPAGWHAHASDLTRIPLVHASVIPQPPAPNNLNNPHPSAFHRYQDHGDRLQVDVVRLTDELETQKLNLRDINEFLTNELKVGRRAVAREAPSGRAGRRGKEGVDRRREGLKIRYECEAVSSGELDSRWWEWEGQDKVLLGRKLPRVFGHV